MKKRDLLELRRRLATATTSASAHDLWLYTERMDLDPIILRGAPKRNELIDRLLSRVATQVFGRTTLVRDSIYYVLWGLWQDLVDIGGVRTWVLYDDITGRGLVGFARHGIDPATWFHPLSRDQLISERSAVA